MTAPVAQDLNLSGNEDTDILATLVASDADLDPLDFFEIVDQPTNGTVQMVSDGGIEEWVYIPNANYTGSDSFTYRTFANGEYSNTATVSITVDPVADAPVLNEALGPQANSNAPGGFDGDATAIAALQSGGYVIVAHGFNQFGDTEGIYAQIYDVDRLPAGSPILVNTTTTDSQFDPQVATLANGDFVVTWVNVDSGAEDTQIHMQRFTSAGVPVGGERLVNSTVGESEQNPEIVALADGGFVVAWEMHNGLESHVFMQRFDSGSSTVGGETQVDVAVGYEGYGPSMAELNNGDYIVTWTSPNSQDGDGQGIFAQRYDNTGTPVGGQFQVNGTTADSQSNAQIVALADGGFAVAWITGPLGINTGITVQKFIASGAPLGNELIVPITDGDVPNFSLVATPDGGYVVAWENVVDGDNAVFMQRADQFGSAVNLPVQIDPVSTNEQTAPSLAMLATGQLALAYSEDPALAGPNSIRHDTFSLPTKTTSVLEGGLMTAIIPFATVSDVDTAAIDSITVTIAGGYRAGDTLTANPGEATGLNVSFTGNTLTISGTGTQAEFSSALSSLRATFHDGGAGNHRQLDIVATSADGTSQTMSVQLDVITTNQNVTDSSGAAEVFGGNGTDSLYGRTATTRSTATPATTCSTAATTATPSKAALATTR